MKHLKRLGFIFTFFFCLTIIATSVAAATEDELNQQKAEATQKKDAAQYQVDMTQTTIDGITAEINKANEQITLLTTKINDLDSKISDLSTQQKNAEDELQKAEAKRDQQQKELEERLRVMYMYGNEGYMEVLFSATDFGDLISKADMVASIAQADQDSAAQLEQTQKEIEKKKATIESNKAQTESAKAEQETLLSQQNVIKAQQDELLAKNNAIIEEYKTEVAKQNAEIKAAEDSLAKIAAEKAAEVERQRQAEEAQRQAEAAANNSSSSSSSDSSSSSGSSNAASSSGYIWPSDCYIITDYFGYRESPGGIGSTNHQGLDIGASYGTPVYAAASGVVTLSQYWGGYGNAVMIAHNDGYTTLYGHNSALAVSEGDYVNQGDVIAYVGSTGNSTGAHIHISFIDSNQNYVDPLNFLPY
ncbi:murein hydrolase activator EnvC family protein [Eubacterium barkeri]|uniref:Septal ring factor EnvC, activator of murein hydrolases AmiA and AmiB n=1 Tax=Eubacterium barkeri TaxID=1528 RepID=A0A1H3E445_EUBBA|nr:M23 family metallopeptidase [Eubacterium barkeri]SDX73451.1 Septal ring factor EnvC, activator of murein hydrolases AmiA and AmiB [Eubacterium barkeri]